MKTCPFCAETDLQDEAIVCKHCGKKRPASEHAVVHAGYGLRRSTGRDLRYRRVLLLAPMDCGGSIVHFERSKESIGT